MPSRRPHRQNFEEISTGPFEPLEWGLHSMESPGPASLASPGRQKCNPPGSTEPESALRSSGVGVHLNYGPEALLHCRSRRPCPRHTGSCSLQLPSNKPSRAWLSCHLVHALIHQIPSFPSDVSWRIGKEGRTPASGNHGECEETPFLPLLVTGEWGWGGCVP